ncbi:MAG: hypothetical protein AB9842_08280 [Bacteroidales bacterium]
MKTLSTKKDIMQYAMSLKLLHGIVYRFSKSTPLVYLLPDDPLPTEFTSGDIPPFRALNRSERRKILKERRH